MKNKKPSPFDFNTPKEYLISAYQYQKVLEPGLSQRYLAVKMGYKSSSAFHDILNGKVFPHKNALNVIKTIFKLNEKEIAFLAILFIVQDIRDPFYKKALFSYIREYKNEQGARVLFADNLCE